MLFGGGGEGGEVYGGGDVLVPGSFIRTAADGMLANGLERSAMASGELFGAGVPVVDDHEKTARHCCGDLIHHLLRGHRRLDTLARFWMDGIAIEKFEFLLRGRNPRFDKAAALRVDPEGAFRAKNFDWKSVEEFVGEDDDRNAASCALGHSLFL